MTVRSFSKRHTICLDLDGTLVENKWPELGDWMPGAIDFCKAMHERDIRLFVFSARLSPYDPYTFQERPTSEVATETFKVREKLDSAGLTFVDIWQLPGKPGASIYIDDRGERYVGSKGAWKAMTDKVLTRLKKYEPELPVFEQPVYRGLCGKTDCAPTCEVCA